MKHLFLLGFFAIGAVSVKGQSINDAIQAYNNAATVYKQDPEKALKDIQSALQIAEQLGEEGAETKQKCEELIPTIYFQIAMFKYKAKDLQATLDNLEKAEKTAIKYNDGAIKNRVEKTMPKLYNAMANNLFKENKFEEAITNYGKAIKLNPNYINPYLGTALAYEALNNEEKMIEFLDLTINIGNKINDVTNVEKAKTKGKVYFLKKANEARNANKLNDVVKLLDLALKYDENDYDIYRLMTINYIKLERWNDAIEYGKKALELVTGTSEDKAELYFLIAGAYQKLNKIDDACTAYKNAAFGTFKPNADYQIQQLKCK